MTQAILWKGEFFMFMIFVFIECMTMPFLLSLYNFVTLFYVPKHRHFQNIVRALTVFLGILDTWVYSDFILDINAADWDVPIMWRYHQPIWSDGIWFYVMISVLSLIGFTVLCARPADKLPPLITVLCMAPFYPLMVSLIVWCIQVCKIPNFLPLWVFPANVFLMIFTVIKEKIIEWNSSVEHDEALYGKNKFFQTLNRWLSRTSRWPLGAFILLLPLLGIIFLILTLFGQQPDIVVKAWTETADYTFSQRIPPPNLTQDGHYLCTVAARGHEGLVRPLRLGERNGHLVVVNRQLEIANAFELVLEERTPRLHRAIRNFYDRHGLPIAKKIRTKCSADFVYIIMKPLEWFFLIVLYLTDVKPENRIHVQYLPGYRNFLNAK